MLVEDAEFGKVEVRKQLEKWHWKYSFINKKVVICSSKRVNASSRLISKPGQSWCLEACWLNIKYTHSVDFLAY